MSCALQHIRGDRGRAGGSPDATHLKGVIEPSLGCQRRDIGKRQLAGGFLSLKDQ
ncbi:hypothetical protein CHELA20_50017 [Hyphomicrobiales bacterium]|nr:hypothetical protein CHELA20_50017 [Hyphomicrobiales bacterium]